MCSLWPGSQGLLGPEPDLQLRLRNRLLPWTDGGRLHLRRKPCPGSHLHHLQALQEPSKSSGSESGIHQNLERLIKDFLLNTPSECGFCNNGRTCSQDARSRRKKQRFLSHEVICSTFQNNGKTKSDISAAPSCLAGGDVSYTSHNNQMWKRGQRPSTRASDRQLPTVSKLPAGSEAA